MAEVKRRWTVVAMEPPALTTKKWVLVSLPGVILLVMAVLQILSFADFRDNLILLGFNSASLVGGLILLAELWGAIGFFKVRLSQLFRAVSNFMALSAAGFWFYESLRQVSEGNFMHFVINGRNSDVGTNFFGRFLHMTPGWWSVIEATLLLWIVAFATEVTQSRSAAKLPVVTRITRKESKKSRR